MIRNLVLIILMFCSVLLNAQIKPMYIGTYTSNGSEGVYVYDFNEDSGASTLIRTIPMRNPSFLAKANNSLYVVNEDNDGGVTAYDLNQNRILNAMPTNGAHPCHISISPIDPIVVVSNYSGGSLVMYSVKSDGSINKQEDFLQFNKSSINSQRQEKSHIHSAFFGQDGKNLFVSDLGGDVVYRYAIVKEELGYKFKIIEEIRTKLGAGPRHVVISADAKRLYVVLELTGEIEVLEQEKGKWLSKQILPIYSPGFEGEHGAADIKMTKNGKFIYATNRGEANEVVSYKVNKNGLLQPIQSISVEGNSPRNIQLSPNEKWVIIANQLSGSISFFKRNTKTGKLSTLQNKLSIPSAVCVVF